jgi:hypothetical protein
MNAPLIVKVRRAYSLAFDRSSGSRQGDSDNMKYSHTLYRRRSFSQDDFFLSYAHRDESTAQNDIAESASQALSEGHNS